MNSGGIIALRVFIVLLLISVCLLNSEVAAQSSYFGGQGCSGCHAAPVTATCSGCHAHGTHPNSGKDSINVAGTLDKNSYAPGEPVTVTMTGGYRTGWFRAVLYDQNMVELARSTGNDSGMGSSATSPAVLTAPAPIISGTYRWKVAWYGNRHDIGGGAFGSGWTADTKNPNHGYEIVSVNSPFTVSTPVVPAPVISSITPNSLMQGADNKIVTINGENLGGATVSFSNAGIIGKEATITATAITLPVTVAATAPIGAGIVTVATGGGSAPAFFSVTDASIPAPAISSITPGSLVQGEVNKVVTISGANLGGATVRFSNGGVIGGPVTHTPTSITLPVIVAANAPTGPGAITVTTVGGTATGTVHVTPRACGPALVVSALSDGSYTKSPTLNISGSVSAVAGIQSVVINSQVIPLMPNGDFSTAVALVAGANTVTIDAIDNAGNLKCDTRTIYYDPGAPLLTVSAPADNSTDAASFITVNGTINETATVAVTVNNGTPQSSSITGNAFSINVNLVPGVNTITIEATDLAGNISRVKRTVNYDTSKLTLAVTSPAQDMTSNRDTMVLMGTVTNSSKEITVTISMDGQTYTHQVTNGIFKQLLTFTAAKQYNIAVNARDAAGNSGSVTRNVIYRPAEGSDVTSPP